MSDITIKTTELKFEESEFNSGMTFNNEIQAFEYGKLLFSVTEDGKVMKGGEDVTYNNIILAQCFRDLIRITSKIEVMQSDSKKDVSLPGNSTTLPKKEWIGK